MTKKLLLDKIDRALTRRDVILVIRTIASSPSEILTQPGVQLLHNIASELEAVWDNEK